MVLSVLQEGSVELEELKEKDDVSEPGKPKEWPQVDDEEGGVDLDGLEPGEIGKKNALNDSGSSSSSDFRLVFEG